MPCDSKDSIYRNFSVSDPNAAGERGKSVTHRPAAADQSPPAERSCELNSPLQTANTARTTLSPLAKRALGTPKPMAVEAERYLTVRDVAQRFAISVQTVWRWAKERPEFPTPVELSPGTTRWRMSDLIAFEGGLSGNLR